MRLDNSYFFFQADLTSEQCDRLVSLGEAKIDALKAADVCVAGKQGAESFVPGQDPDSIPAGILTADELKNSDLDLSKVYTRDSSVAWLQDEEIYQMLTPYVQYANLHAGWNFDWDQCEDLQYSTYEAADGKEQFLGWHIDTLPPHPSHAGPNFEGKIRKLSMTVNLSSPEDYDGGDLMFDLGPHEGGPRFHVREEIRLRGSVIVFPSHIPHAVSPVTSGKRKSMVLWCCGAPFR